MKEYFLILFCLQSIISIAQIPVRFPENIQENQTELTLKNNQLEISWPIANENKVKMILNLVEGEPLIHNLGILENGNFKKIAENMDPRFLLNVGSRTLKPENGWTIFFDKVPTRPYTSDILKLHKKQLNITKNGSRTHIQIGELSAADFKGTMEITIFNNEPLINFAAVVSTAKDSTAILYDAGLVSETNWDHIAFAKPDKEFKKIEPAISDHSEPLAVKYRTIIGGSKQGSLAVFPPPHQYFYPLDEAFNLKFTWHGENYRNMLPRYGIGIRQDPEGDHRYVPWFNAPPNTQQRLNFFCLLGVDGSENLLESVKKYTHSDTYKPLPSYKTMASHFHNEYIMNVVMSGKSKTKKPAFVEVFKEMGVDIVHLGEFHYTAHPKGPDHLRLQELDALFKQCRLLSDEEFLLLPGEEPNEFLGGHWMAIFPKPVYWIMDREDQKPFVTQDPNYGKVYRIKDKTEMLKLLEEENGLAWTAHPRIKGSTGYPDTYKNEEFFISDRFLGGAWKAMPADLSLDRLGVRVLDLLDDMNNWGNQKKVIAESDLFTVTHENEMYAHMNINYMAMDELPSFNQGWPSVLTAMTKGKFFSSTGEILIPSFTVNNTEAGETSSLPENSKSSIDLKIDWTFPLNYVEIISGDGEKVFRERISMRHTTAFGSQELSFSVDLQSRKWVRVEVWDAAVNGAFTQTVYLKN